MNREQETKRFASIQKPSSSLFTVYCSLFGVLCLSSCVPLDQLPPETRAKLGAEPTTVAAAPEASAFPDIDPGGTEMTTLHFHYRGYSEQELRTISVMAESLYNSIASVTGLYSYLSPGPYNVVVYKDRDEYLAKTRMPKWSRAVAVRDAIFLYPGPDVEPTLAHELTHLLFNTFMGEGPARKYRWINEGLAMNQEMAKWPDGERARYAASAADQLRNRRLPFSQMTFFVPASEEDHAVDAWYQQVQSVTAYLLQQGSALSFAGFLIALRSDTDPDRAIADNYPGKFRSLADLEAAWKHTI